MADGPRIGIALGSGSARGWAHIGVLKALEAAGVRPTVVCGTSIGALVGAAYASDRLAELEEWVLDLDLWAMLRLIDPRRGGVMEGERLMRAFTERVADVPIESLPKVFGAVATDLVSGREVWLHKGSLGDAVRASIALPGLFKPVRLEGHWLADGGLVDPVPVSLCRALGAERVIAVNLNGDIVGRHFQRRTRRTRAAELLEQISARFQLGKGVGATEDRSPTEENFGLFDVMAGAMNIMQDRITRSRMAGDPPDLLLAPRLAHLALMDFDRAAEAIAAGETCVRNYRAALRDVLNLELLDPQGDDDLQVGRADP